MEIGQTYDRSIKCIRDGEVVTWDGRPVYFRDLIKRRWGWPKKAAIAASALIKAQAQENGKPAVLWVNQPERSQQQQFLFSALPGLMDTLCAGLCNGSSREAEDCDHEIVGIQLSFTRAITDDGLIRDITSALARRLGCNAEDVREVTTYNTGSPVVTLRVDTERFGAEGAVVDGCRSCMRVDGHSVSCPLRGGQ